MNHVDLSERDIRQRDLVPPERLAACHALVIGVGAIGRQVALQLAALGVPALTLFDDDKVGVENLAPQGYFPEDLGVYKVMATEALCHRINPGSQIRTVAERFRRSSAKNLPTYQRLVVFSCVDSISTRKLIWEALRLQTALFIDGRMSAEVVRVLVMASPATDEHYADTLFASEQAYVGSCTAKSTIYSASIAAGFMVGQMTKWLRELPIDADVTLNLLSMELAVTGESFA